MRLAALVLIALAVTPVSAARAQEAQREMVLTLPRPLAAGDTAFVEVQVGAIPRGRTIAVMTASGQSLGTLSGFGNRTKQDAGTFTVPVPATAIANGRLALRLSISQPGGAPRAPTADEVRGVKLTVGAAR